MEAGSLRTKYPANRVDHDSHMLSGERMVHREGYDWLIVDNIVAGVPYSVLALRFDPIWDAKLLYPLCS